MNKQNGPVGCSGENPKARCCDPIMLQRMRWRCRRGLLELDLILERFVETHYTDLTAQEQQLFDEMLDMPDNPLWDMISGKQETLKPTLRPLLERIRAA